VLTRRKLLEELRVISKSSLDPFPVASKDGIMALFEVPGENILSGVQVAILSNCYAGRRRNHDWSIRTGSFLACNAIAHGTERYYGWIE